LQGERGGDEAGAQIKARQQRASGYVDASKDRTSEQAGYKSDERSETKIEGLGRWEPQAEPQRKHCSSNPDRKISKFPIRDNKPNAEEEGKAGGQRYH
jgi:hypothetical protein